MKRLFILLVFCLGAASAVLAQAAGGQLWVRAFDDRNGNALRDSNEPFLTRGVSVDLLDSNGIVIATATLEGSPNAGRGLVGFQQLPAGSYTLNVSSAEYEATTASSFTVEVSESGVPPVVDFGARLPDAAVQPQATGNTAAAALSDQDQLLQIALSVAGAVFVMFVMVLVGTLIYLATFRKRAAAAAAADRRATHTTGSMRPVRVETGENQRVTGENRRV